MCPASRKMTVTPSAMAAVPTVVPTPVAMTPAHLGGLGDRARKLRQAVSIAVDWEEYISIFANGRGLAGMGPIPPGIFGYRDAHTLKYAARLGLALQLTNILRDLDEDADLGRVYMPAEAMAAAGEQAGLPADVALKLARGTVEGSGELLFREAATSAAQLRKNVTSPGGTTAAALEVLMGPEGLTELMSKAVAAAKRRAGELSG